MSALIASRMFETATTMGIALDSGMSCVQTLDDGTVRVVATVDTFPDSEGERDMTRSALHAALLEDLADVGSLEVSVFVPPASGPTVQDVGKTLSSEQIAVWKETVTDFVAHAMSQLAYSACMHVVSRYPWADRDGMIARVPEIMQEFVRRVKNGALDPLSECVDLLLPPLATVILDHEAGGVHEDVLRVLGDVPRTLLHFYEVLHLCSAHRVAVSSSTIAVIGRVFSA